MRGGGRLTNLALLCLLALAFASGWVAFELSGQPARATLVIHAAAGVAIVLLVPWKALVARRGLRRPRRLRWARPSCSRSGWSYLSCSASSTPAVDTSQWLLAAGGRQWSYDDLNQFDDRVTAVLDCTGGWYSEQEWAGVWLNRLLPTRVGGTSSVYVRSVTGYGRRFDISEAPRLLLATRLDGAALESGHGFPVRLVAPGRRGFAWVKWVVSAGTDTAPWWWQPPFPLQ
jgi:DMSO/TMAO reductase YedYZ molybdopterin-dependent catalytic subunit